MCAHWKTEFVKNGRECQVTNRPPSLLSSPSAEQMLKKSNPVAVEAEMQALISENSSFDDVVIHTDSSVVCQVQSIWAFTAQ